MPGADNWADAASIGLNMVSDSTPNTGLTLEPDEPNDIAGSDYSAWWQFTPAESGSYFIDTHLTSPSDAFTVLEVFTGDVLDDLTLITWSMDSLMPDQPSLLAAAQVDAEADTTYWIRVSAYDPGIEYVLRVRLLAVGDWVDTPADDASGTLTYPDTSVFLGDHTLAFFSRRWDVEAFVQDTTGDDVMRFDDVWDALTGETDSPPAFVGPVPTRSTLGVTDSEWYSYASLAWGRLSGDHAEASYSLNIAEIELSTGFTPEAPANSLLEWENGDGTPSVTVRITLDSSGAPTPPNDFEEHQATTANIYPIPDEAVDDPDPSYFRPGSTPYFPWFLGEGSDTYETSWDGYTGTTKFIVVPSVLLESTPASLPEKAAPNQLIRWYVYNIEISVEVSVEFPRYRFLSAGPSSTPPYQRLFPRRSAGTTAGAVWPRSPTAHASGRVAGGYI